MSEKIFVENNELRIESAKVASLESDSTRRIGTDGTRCDPGYPLPPSHYVNHTLHYVMLINDLHYVQRAMRYVKAASHCARNALCSTCLAVHY